MTVLKRLAAILIGLIAILYLGATGLLFFLQRDFQYAPAGEVFEPQAVGFSGEVVTIPTGGDEIVTGWYAPPRDGMPVILYFKGNAGSFSAEHVRYRAFSEAGYGVLAFDYRGFPASPGVLSEENILADALSAYDWLAREGHPILIWGRSLGSGPASYVASVREAEALLLETPFYSAVSVAGERYGFLPVGWLMHDQFRVDQWIGEVAEPVFVAHGTADEVISVGNGERVFAAAPNAVELWIEPGGTHGDLWARGIWERARAFFESVNRGG
ncbi:alpha/beta hydrolase [Arsenicitalea aurantiaca]|uniref:Alpha/beta hydrolase n=1 Tax=Arsenicitalea aurantiaca TaxID=1783274 RepID=A0A433XKK3_9HYPH|nr:alpha/beta hydrolase [Arsenicitalea aurantiaca]RUT34622.1 alpha/beta hydrolase [Arsenicitalea aurantiaca]